MNFRNLQATEMQRFRVAQITAPSQDFPAIACTSNEYFSIGFRVAIFTQKDSESS